MSGDTTYISIGVLHTKLNLAKYCTANRNFMIGFRPFSYPYILLVSHPLCHYHQQPLSLQRPATVKDMNST